MKKTVITILIVLSLLLCGCKTDNNEPLFTSEIFTYANPVVTYTDSDTMVKQPSVSDIETETEAETKPDTIAPETESHIPDIAKDFTIPFSEINYSGNNDDLNAVISYGEWLWDTTCVTVKSGPAIAVVCNDLSETGSITITANMTSLANSDVNDNGIIFGLDETVLTNEDERNFFEDGAPYYFLFVNDGGSLHLSKVNYDGTVWQDFGASNPLSDYTHGDTFEITVVYDGEGYIECYFNDKLIMQYQDGFYLTGRAYGIRAETAGVKYNSLKVEY